MAIDISRPNGNHSKIPFEKKDNAVKFLRTPDAVLQCFCSEKEKLYNRYGQSFKTISVILFAIAASQQAPALITAAVVSYLSGSLVQAATIQTIYHDFSIRDHQDQSYQYRYPYRNLIPTNKKTILESFNAQICLTANRIFTPIKSAIRWAKNEKVAPHAKLN